uniref:Uncharacterized protein n=1 Tax=Arundo donax TaxID=35708 RepID=A0A0A9CUG0_ARUDO
MGQDLRQTRLARSLHIPLRPLPLTPVKPEWSLPTALFQVRKLLDQMTGLLQGPCRISDVKLQLQLALDVILRLDIAQENRGLTPEEQSLRTKLKRRILGLTVIERSLHPGHSTAPFPLHVLQPAETTVSLAPRLAMAGLHLVLQLPFAAAAVALLNAAALEIHLKAATSMTDSLNCTP